MSSSGTNSFPHYSSDQIAEHSTPSDCWIQLRDGVFDVTKYLSAHPGGAEVILDTAGGDASDMFEDIGHSKYARKLLDVYRIGNTEIVSKPESTDTTDTIDSITIMVYVAFGILMGIAIYSFGGMTI
jgi:cytochrome b involved in lipid metabolism